MCRVVFAMLYEILNFSQCSVTAALKYSDKTGFGWQWKLRLWT